LRPHVRLGVGFAAGIMITAPLMLAVRTDSSLVAPRPAPLPLRTLPVRVAPASPANVPRRPALQVAGRKTAVRPPPVPASAAPRPAPVVVPPLQEDATEPLPVASSEGLKRLRDEYRRMPVLRLETVMDGVRRACGSAAWQRGGWRDYRLEFALDELIYRVKRATERPDLKLPVRFGEVPAGVAENAKGVLTAARSVKLRSATGCIFLVDGDVDVVEARECVILTTGEAKVPYGSGNIILAGGALEGAENRSHYHPRLSLWISGTSISIRNSSGLVLSAPAGVEASSLRDSVLLNSPVRNLSYLSGCSEYTADWVDLRSPPRELGDPNWRPDDRDGEDQAPNRRAIPRNRSGRRK
jgi:hypothetical protein